MNVQAARIALISVLLLVGACGGPVRQKSAGPSRSGHRHAERPKARRPVARRPKPANSLPVVPKLYAVQTQDPVVALTFDDGPDPANTPQVLDLLARYDSRATFFVLGEAAERYPELLRRVAASGNELGNHGWGHSRMTSLAGERLAEEIRRSSNQITQLGGQKPRSVRPPYGAFNKGVVQAANELGETVVLWSIDPRDWTNPSPGQIAGRVLGNVRPGSIILLHDGGGRRAATVRALPMILQGLRQRGYRAVPVRDLVRLGAPVSQDPGT